MDLLNKLKYYQDTCHEKAYFQGSAKTIEFLTFSSFFWKFPYEFSLSLFNLFSTADVKSWKQKFNNADFGANKNKQGHGPKDEKLIQWAGGLHQRQDFNKRRDPLG